MLSTRSISLPIVDLTSEEINNSAEGKSGSSTSNSAKETTSSSAIPKQHSLHGTYKAGPLLQNVSVKDFCDPYGPYQIQDRISAVVKQWAKVVPQSPPSFLAKLLPSRGYQYKTIQAMQSRFKMPPSSKQLMDYDSELVMAVRVSDLAKLKELHSKGSSMNACNKFGESIVHMACRRSTFEVVDFIMRNGGSSWFVDDFGRTPLHDACWRSEPRFDIVTLILNVCPELLFVQDVRGSLALNYVREEHWLQWCAYFYHQRDKYWPVAASGSTANTASNQGTVAALPPQSPSRGL